MRNRIITLLGLISLSPLFIIAQDYDDIYYDGSSQKAKEVTTTTTTTNSNQYTNLSKQAPTYATTNNIVEERDVDEYNRRGQNDLYNPSDSLANTKNDFQYTEKIEKYYNPEVVKNQNDPELEELYYTTGQTTVNLIIGVPSVYNSWYSGGSYYDPWNWRYSSYWDPWYSPYYSPYYNPWNWGYHHHHYCPPYYYPVVYRNSNNGRNPYGNYGNSGRRPGYSTAGRRPNSESGISNSRPGQYNRPNRDGQTVRRPGYNSNDRNSESTINRRPATNTDNQNRRPSGNTERPSYRENNRRSDYNSTPSYNSTPNYGGSSRGGYSGGGNSGGGGGGGHRGGGGRR